jgi:hypothetical protein
MSETARRRAVETYRRRLEDRGMARFEVVGLDTDRELVRAVARRLAEGDAGAVELRARLDRSLGGGRTPAKGGILAALRRSPLVGTDLDLTREKSRGRKIEL